MWDGNNINSFLKLFGDDFKKIVLVDEIKNKPELEEGVKKFLELGNQRNNLVHSNFASATIDGTLDEIKEKYRGALKFVEYLTSKLKIYN